MILIVSCLVLVLLFAYFSNERDIFSPSVLFTVSFLFSSLWALAYASKWALIPSLNTILVIIFGTCEFVVVATFITKVMLHKPLEEKNTNLSFKEISTWKKLLIIVIELAITLFIIKSLKAVTGLQNLSQAIYRYRSITLFTSGTLDISKSVYIAHYFCSAVGFFFLYSLIKKIILVKKIDFLLLTAVLISVYESTLFGSRTGVIVFVLAGVTYYYCLIRVKDEKKFIVKPKFYLYGAGLMMLFILGFRQLAGLLGRTIDARLSDYLAEYLGAEIKNLDTFIRGGNFPLTTDIFHSQTLMYISKVLGRTFGQSGLDYKLDLPFQMSNGFDLGNVYSMYYQFLYDLGYVGVFIFVLLMAIIVQVIYVKARSYHENGHISYSILIYGYIVSSLLLSFFSNKFYEQVATSSFVYIIFFWWILDKFVRKNIIFKMYKGERKL